MRRHEISLRNLRRTTLIALVAGAVTISATVALSDLPAGSATKRGQVSDPSLSATTITPGGGDIVVTATPSQDSTCSVEVSPAIGELPKAIPCDAGWPVQFSLDIPSNTKSAPLHYSISVTSCGASAPCAKSSPLKLTEWAYNVTFASLALSNDFVAAACPTETFCLALDSSGAVHEVAAIRGKVKDVKHDPGTMRLSTVACGSISFCIAADTAGDVVTWNGPGKLALSPNVIPTKGALAVSSDCSSDTWCFLNWSAGVGSAKGVSGTPGVQNWRGIAHWGNKIETSTYVTPGVPTGFSCLVGTSTCVAADNLGFITTFDGKTTVSSTPAPSAQKSGGFASISCGSASSCVAADTGGSLIDFQPADAARGGTNTGSVAFTVGTKVICPLASLCSVTGGTSGQIASREKLKATTKTQGDFNLSNRVAPSSPTFTPDRAGTSPNKITVVVAAGNAGRWAIFQAPAVSRSLVAFSSSKQYVGHVTLIKQ